MLFFDQPPHDEQFAFEFGVAGEFAAVDEQLPDGRAAALRLASDRRRLHGDFPPADNGTSFRFDGFFDGLFRAETAEDHGDGVGTGRGQFQAGPFPEKFIGQTEQKTGSVAGFRIAARRAAVHQTRQDRDPFFHNVMARFAAEVGRHADSAGIVFLLRTVERVRLLSK